MEYRTFGKEQRREFLENHLRMLEAQHYGRVLDLRSWRQVKDAPLTQAAGIDDRIVNNRDEEAKQQLSLALYDIEKLEIKIRQMYDELDALGPKAGAPVSGDGA